MEEVFSSQVCLTFFRLSFLISRGLGQFIATESQTTSQSTNSSATASIPTYITEDPNDAHVVSHKKSFRCWKINLAVIPIVSYLRIIGLIPHRTAEKTTTVGEENITLQSNPTSAIETENFAELGYEVLPH